MTKILQRPEEQRCSQRAYEGLDLTISVGVGRKKTKFLSFEQVKRSIQALLNSDVELRKLEVSANEDETGRNIDFLEEHLSFSEKLELPDGNPDKNYEVRKKLLRSELDANLDYLVTHWGHKDAFDC